MSGPAHTTTAPITIGPITRRLRSIDIAPRRGLIVTDHGQTVVVAGQIAARADGATVIGTIAAACDTIAAAKALGRVRIVPDRNSRLPLTKASGATICLADLKTRKRLASFILALSS